MTVDVAADPAAVARRAAAFVAAEARAAVTQRGRFVVAVSGGKTPWLLLKDLAGEDVPWVGVHLLQVDERVAPPGDPDRNLDRLRESLADAPLRPEQIHAMPVEADDLEAAASAYAREIEALAGAPAVLDLVHLGLGADGHTASLVPGDPLLGVLDADVGVSGVYQGRRRLSLTYPILNRARRVLWVVTGGEKADALARLRLGDRSIPAGRVNGDRAFLLADAAAAGA